MDEFNKINLYASLLKTTTGKYKAVLSDDSIDREDEIVGKSFLEGALAGKTFGLIDHENKVENRVCDWVNKKMEFIKGHNALTAEPKFFMSNPKAQLIKGLLDDGAELGVSIGAIPTDSDTVKINDKEYKRYTKGTIIEGSFVGIPANANAGARNILQSNCRTSNLLIAKSLDFVKIEEGKGKEKPYKNRIQNLNLEEISMEKNEESIKTTEQIILAMKDAKKDDVIKALQAAGIEESVYVDLIKDLAIEKPKQPGSKKPKKPEEDEDELDERKVLSTEDIQKIVTEKMKETPLFKLQADLEMTPEQTEDKAAEIMKSGKLPIIGGGI